MRSHKRFATSGRSLGYLDANTEKWIGKDIAAASVAVDKKLDGTSASEAIIIDDSDDEIEKPITPVSTRILPSKFRVPPAASLITPRTVDKVLVSVDLSENDHKEGTPSVERACTAAKYNTDFPSPQSLEKEDANSKALRITGKKSKPMKARSTKANKRPANNDSDLESADDIPMSPPTIGSTRKRRDIDYDKALFNDQDVDDSDEDYEYEEMHDDRSLNEKYDSWCPVLATLSKRLKKTKS